MKFSPLYIRAAIALAMVISFNARAEDAAPAKDTAKEAQNTEVRDMPARGGVGGGHATGGGAEHGPSGGGRPSGGGEPHVGGGGERPEPSRPDPRPVGPVGGDHGGDHGGRPDPIRPEPVRPVGPIGDDHGHGGGDRPDPIRPEPIHPVGPIGGDHGGERPDPRPGFGGGHPHGFPTQHGHWQDPQGRNFWRWSFSYEDRPCYIYYVDTGTYSDSGNHATVADQNAADEVASEAQDYINEIEALRASGAPVVQLSAEEMSEKYPSFLYTAEQDQVVTTDVVAMEDLAKAIVQYDAGLAE